MDKTVSSWLVGAINELNMAKCNIEDCTNSECKGFTSEYEHTDSHVDAALDLLCKTARYYKVIK